MPCVFSAIKQSISACRALFSVWFERKSLKHHYPTRNLSPHFPPSSASLSSALHTPTGLDIFSVARINTNCVSASNEMKQSIRAVEQIVGYNFKNKTLLEEALTHSSYTKSTSYQRLEFIGDSALDCAVSNYLFLAYPDIGPGQLSLLRSANISTEKLARVAIRLKLYQYVRHNASIIDEKVREFADAIQDEEDAVAYGGSLKAPKILADIVESVAAAIYVDCNFDVQTLWVIFRCLLEPMVMLNNLQQQPQPVTTLFELCQKEGKKVDIKRWRKGFKNTARVYVDGKLVASSRTEQKETAKLNVAKAALQKLEQIKMTKENYEKFNGVFEIDGAKHKLHEVCQKNNWPKPNYKTEEEVGPVHDRKFLCSVHVEAANICKGSIMGDMKSRVKDAENSAASNMLRKLQQYL